MADLPDAAPEWPLPEDQWNRVWDHWLRKKELEAEDISRRNIKTRAELEVALMRILPLHRPMHTGLVAAADSLGLARDDVLKMNEMRVSPANRYEQTKLFDALVRSDDFHARAAQLRPGNLLEVIDGKCRDFVREQLGTQPKPYDNAQRAMLVQCMTLTDAEIDCALSRLPAAWESDCLRP